jgi:Subtilase family
MTAVACSIVWAVPARATSVSPLPASDYTVRSACAVPAPRHMGCLAQLLVPRTAAAHAHTHPLGLTRSHAMALAKASEGAYGLRPQDLRSAYFPGEQPDAPASEPQTVALVDAYNDLDAEADLKVFAEEFDLPECEADNGCFKQVNQKGEAGNLPFPNSEQSRLEMEILCENKTVDQSIREAACQEVEEADEWALETSVDIEVVHAVCQNCHIDLVEAESGEYTSLEAAEDAAVQIGATEVSNSWGGEEPLGDSEAFNHPGTVITVAAGDSGYLNWDMSQERAEKENMKMGGVNYPASSPHVVAVGGTDLVLNGSTEARSSETAWSGSGGGCSLWFMAQEWQRDVSDWSRVGCEERRAVADISAEADPYPGVAIYDSVPYARTGSGLGAAGVLGWTTIGGTSVASPIIAAMFALAGGAHGIEYPAQTLYSHLGAASLYDATEGASGQCGGDYSAGCSGSMDPLSPSDCGREALICNAAGGYDGPSGVGAPNGVEAFKPTRQYRSGGPEAPITETCGEHVGSNGEQHVCGMLNPYSDAKAGYYFVYNKGMNCTGGRETAVAMEVQGEAIPVSSELTGLEPDTLYSYCLIATDDTGETSGPVSTFTTEPAAPKIPEMRFASKTTSNSTTLRGKLGAEQIKVVWFFEYSAGESCTAPGAKTTPEEEDTGLGEPDEVSTEIIALQPGTVYTVCLYAKNRIGTTTSSEVWFATESIGPTIGWVSASSTNMEVTFAAEVNPNAQAATCEVLYGTSETYGSRIPCKEGLGTGGSHVLASAHATGLKPSTMYYFQIVAENEISKSLPDEGKGMIATQPEPPTVVGESVLGVSSTTAVVAGTIKPELMTTRYYFEYGETESYGQSTAGGEVDTGAGEVQIGPETIGNLQSDTTYYCRLRAITMAGEAVGEVKSFRTPMDSPIVAVIPPPVFATVPITTTGPAPKLPAFSGLVLPAVQHGGSLLIDLTIDFGGSGVEVDVTAPATWTSSIKMRHRPKRVALARLVRTSVPAGRLKLTLPLSAKGRWALRRQKRLTVTVRLTVTPPAGNPRVATQAITLRDEDPVYVQRQR